jgi:hypothetical protein
MLGLPSDKNTGFTGDVAMRNLASAVVGLLAIYFCAVPNARANTQSVLFNVDGAQYNNYTAPGMNAAGYSDSTGLGTIVFADNPGTIGSHAFTAFFDQNLNLPFFNEFGTVVGVPAAGQSWQIGDSFTSSIYPNTQSGSLSNSNDLPGQASNYSNKCMGTNCNGDAALALGFNFTLGANQLELITLTFSTTKPLSGFYLQQTHPTDPNTTVPLNVYFTGSAVTEPTGPPTTPEPPTAVLAITAACIIALKLRR